MHSSGLRYAAPTLEQVDQPDGLGEPLVLAWGEGSDTIRQGIYLHAEGGPVIHTLEGSDCLAELGRRCHRLVRRPCRAGRHATSSGSPVDAPAGNAWSLPPVVLVIIALAIGIAAASRFVNSRLGPVVFDQ